MRRAAAAGAMGAAVMNAELRERAAAAGLTNAARERLRLAFGLACARRVRHLLEEPTALAAVDLLQDVVDGRARPHCLRAAAPQLQELARAHRGSVSIDGAAHAAVSATHAVAHALAGRALDAADYAAYAMVYAYASHAAADPAAYDGEFAWQLAQLQALLDRDADRAGPAELG
jgi:hypothetical protein